MENWLLSVAVKKGIYAGAKALVAFLLSAKAVALEKRFGIILDPNTFQIAVGSALFGMEHDLHEWLKKKYPNAKWL